MQEQHRQVLLFAVSVLIIATGIGLYLKKRHTVSSDHSYSQPLQAENSMDRSLQRDVAAQRLSESPLPGAQPLTEAQKAEGKGAEFEAVCPSAEYRGGGQKESQVSKADWARVVGQFHDAKRLLREWLTKNRKSISEKTADYMDMQIQNLKVIRPPSVEEPDLNWRGIGVWTRDGAKSSALRISGGFVKLVIHEPQRALFELTRLVAQSWTPCELRRAGAEMPWEPLLRCLEVADETNCASGASSETGWAVSSSVAAEVAPPGCTLPAFHLSEKNRCMQKAFQTISTTDNRVYAGKGKG